MPGETDQLNYRLEEHDERVIKLFSGGEERATLRGGIVEAIQAKYQAACLRGETFGDLYLEGVIDGVVQAQSPADAPQNQQ